MGFGRLAAIKWVRQEASGGCIIASLAMLAGKPYSEINALYPWISGDRGGDFDTIVRDFSYREGFAVQAIWQYQAAPTCPADQDHRVYYDNLRRKPWPPEPWAPAHLCSVNTSQYHAVVMLSDGTVLDPLGPGVKRLSDYKKVAQVWGVWDVRMSEKGL